MEWIEEEGKTFDEAVDRALARIGKRREEIDVEIVEESKKVFGILGSKHIRVRVYYNASSPVAEATEPTPEPASAEEEDASAVMGKAKSFLSEIMDKMGIEGLIETFDRDGVVYLNIVSDKGGLLIGRGGKTLDALQYLVNRRINKDGQEKRRVIVDVESYRERHRQRIIRLAEKMAGQAKDTGNTVVTPPMNPYDRRTFHVALKDDAEVTTESSGEGFLRRVHVIPRS